MIAINYEVYDSNFNAALQSKISVLNNFEVNYTTGLEVLIKGKKQKKKQNKFIKFLFKYIIYIFVIIFNLLCIFYYKTGSTVP